MRFSRLMYCAFSQISPYEGKAPLAPGTRGGWPDLDQLRSESGLPGYGSFGGWGKAFSRATFTLSCILGSPLLISSNLSSDSFTAWDIETFGNSELLLVSGQYRTIGQSDPYSSPVHPTVLQAKG